MGIIVELKSMRDTNKKNLVRLGVYYIYLLLVWGSFRYWVRLPEVIEELWFKPIIWLLPLFWWRMSLKGKPELFNNKWWLSGGLGALVGLGYFVLVRVLNMSEPMLLNWNMVGVLLATAVIEELTFSGLVLGIMDWMNGKKVINIVIVALMVVGVHLPINVFVNGLVGKELLGVVLWLFSMASINGWLRQRTGSVVGSMVARLGLMMAVLG